MLCTCCAEIPLMFERYMTNTQQAMSCSRLNVGLALTVGISQRKKAADQ